MTEVTKRHRELAFFAIYPNARGGVWDSERYWIAHGDTKAGYSVHTALLGIAQAISDAEERGTPGAQNRAWREGYAANEADSSYSGEQFTPCPYPA